MLVVNLHGRVGFSRLAIVEIGAKELLPTLPTIGARVVDSALALRRLRWSKPASLKSG